MLTSRRLGLALALGAMTLLAASACGAKNTAPTPEASPAATDDGERPPGVKPDHVACDPDRPEMPCTQEPKKLDTPPAPDDREEPRPGVKPHYVKCDPERPEMPCTPDAAPADLEGPRPGVKPHYVKCDPERPELPCTPDAPRPTE